MCIINIFNMIIVTGMFQLFILDWYVSYLYMLSHTNLQSLWPSLRAVTPQLQRLHSMVNCKVFGLNWLRHVYGNFHGSLSEMVKFKIFTHSWSAAQLETCINKISKERENIDLTSTIGTRYFWTKWYNHTVNWSWNNFSQYCAGWRAVY